MELLKLIAAYVLATLFQLPFLVMLALPWLALAVLAAFITRSWRGMAPRIILVAGLAAIGLAPAYGFHLSMMPAYALLMSHSIEPAEAVARILETWAIFVLLVVAFRWIRAKRKQGDQGAEQAG
jgi:hypothetical protein